jgi:hypothetical protein
MLTLPGGDPEAREGFAWQMEAVQRHLRDLPGDTPESAHLSGIAEAVPATGKPSPGLRLTLTAYAYFLEHEGRLEEALDILSLASCTHGPAIAPADYAATALFAGRLNRLLARWERACTCYSAAETAAWLSGDMVAVLRARLGRGGPARTGNLPSASPPSWRSSSRRSAWPARGAHDRHTDLGAVRSQGQYAVRCRPSTGRSCAATIRCSGCACSAILASTCRRAFGGAARLRDRARVERSSGARNAVLELMELEAWWAIRSPSAARAQAEKCASG